MVGMSIVFDVNLVEKRWNIWDDRGKMKVASLSCLERMAGGNEPFYVLL